MTKCKVIAIANQKGGVGKTTTTINLGVGLVKQGKRVLLIDTDPQGDLTTALGFKEADKIKVTIKDLMQKVIKEVPIEENEGIIKHEEGVEIIPANIELEALEVSLIKITNKENVLKRYINQIRNNYDYVLIDCKPSLGLLTINALSSADSVIIPVQAQYLPMKGMTQLLDTINRIKTVINPNLKIEGILLTIADIRTRLAKVTRNSLIKNYKNKIKVYDTIIPVATKVAESSLKGQSIYAYSKSSKPAQAYEELVKEVIQNSEKQRLRNCQYR